MPVDAHEAARLATDYANAHGYRVVPGFDGVVWCDGPGPVKFEGVRRIDDVWAVVFETLLPPEVETECPGAICVTVADDAACEFFPLL